jgi:D-serine deaminase-like pyridoxal phosphate-dependent protein
MIPNAYLASLSQEHGVIQADAALCQQVRPGDVLAVLPVHSCLTAHLMHCYLTLRGEEIGMMPLP